MIPIENLKVALLQTELAWEDSEANLRAFDAQLSDLKRPVDLVVLPEMFNTGFTMNAAEMAQDMEGEVVSWLEAKSTELDAAICGSAIIKEGDKYFNRMLYAVNGRVRLCYDKRHLFRMAGEDGLFSPGAQRPMIELKGWRIMPRVCYDLRFPVWNRNYDCDLQIYIANWPRARVDAWDKLLMARAIENQCYVVGVNRVGQDGNDIAYSGHSVVLDPKGNALTPAENESNGWIYGTLDMEALEEFRKKFPVYLDGDEFDIKL